MKYAKNTHPEASNAAPGLIAWHVVERNGQKAFWTRIGAAWEHDDKEGFTAQIDLMPTATGRIVFRTRRDNDEKPETVD